MDIREHGAAVYEIVRRNAEAKYKVYPCTHYEIYGKYYRDASNLALDWFRRYL